MKMLLAVMMLMPMVALADKTTVDGIEWTYTVKDGEAQIIAGLSTKTKGAITIPSTLGGCPVTSIGFEAFADCNGLTSVTIPSGVVRICDFAFPGCDGLKDLIIASSVTNISDNAFNGSCGLMLFSVDSANPVYSSRNGLLCSKDGSVLIAGGNGDVTVPSVVTSIRTCAFTCHHGLKSVTIPASVTNIGFDAFGGCSGLMSFSVDPANSVYSSCNGLLCLKDGSALVCGLNGDVTIPASVTKIEEGMFEGCSRLMSFSVESGNPAFSARNGLLCTKNGDSLVVGVNGDVTIPPSVTSIRSCAFAGYDGLKTVGIPSSVTNIGHGAFLNCWALESVTIPDGVTSIESRVFENCEKLKEMTIPTNVTRIGFTAFLGCRGLTSMTIPSRVKNIERGAFSRCYELVSVTMRGERPKTKGEVFDGCKKLTAIHVPANAKSWAGMKTWQGIPLVFDGKLDCSTTDNLASETNVVARQFQGCDFLLNKEFKRDAKVYLCLFSASWCGPCRAEMPRIAKAYAETLKADPDIELVHFSCDRDDDKALAWAKEHDVKFPVVKPKGGNPLGLKARGIPHLFIVRADGTLVEEGHPSKLFSVNRIRALVGEKGKAALDAMEMKDLTWTYEIVRGAVVLGGKGKTAIPKDTTGALVIPAAIDGKPVRTISAEAFRDCRRISSVTMPSTVTSIGNRAFQGCCCLTTVAIPDGVASIGECAFLGCGALGSVIISKSVRSIGNFAFYDCGGLKSFVVDTENPTYSSCNDMLCSKDGRTLICGVNGHVAIPSGVTHIGERRFAKCKGLISVAMPSTVKSIASDAFVDCCELTSFTVDSKNSTYSSTNGLLCSKDGRTLVRGVNGNVTIPTSVTSIGEMSFAGCSGLKSVTIPSSVTNVGMSAFSGCGGLKSVTIPKGVAVIGKGAFSGCCELKSVAIPSSVTDIGERAFYGSPELYMGDPNGGWSVRGGDGPSCNALMSFSVDPNNPSYCSRNGMLCSKDGSLIVAGVNGDVTIPEGVKCIGSSVFADCSKLTSVTISSSVTNIGYHAFYNCRELKSVEIPLSVESVGVEAFSRTPFYNNLPDGMAVLGRVLYEYKGKCPASVTIPSNVTCIAKGAFGGCGELKSVTIPSSVTCVEKDSFNCCSVLLRRRTASACGSILAVSVDVGNPAYSSRNGLLCSKDGSVLIAGVNGDVMIPECVKSIGKSAFSGCRNLTSVTIPPSVTNIGANAFAGCVGLAAVTIPPSVTNIGRAAFHNCPKLKSVDVVRDGEVESVPLDEFRKLERSLLGGRNRNEAGRRMGSLRERRALRAKRREDAAKAAEAAKQQDADAAKKAEGGR